MRDLIGGWLILGTAAAALAAGGCAPTLSAINTGAALSDKDLAMGWSLGANAETDGFAEQFVVRTQMADGVAFSAKLQISNLAGQDGRASLGVRVTLKDGSSLEYSTKADRGEWEAAKDHLAVRVGHAHIEGSVGKVTVRVDDDDLKLAFELTSQLPPLRPLGGRFASGGATYVTTVDIPRGVAHLVVDTPSRDAFKPPEDAPATAPTAPTAPSSPAKDPIVAPAPTTPPAPGQAPPAHAPSADVPPPSANDAPAEAPHEDAELPEEGPVHLEFEGIGYAEDRWGNVPPYEVAKRWEQVLIIGPDETLVLSSFERPSNVALVPGQSGDVHGWLMVATDDALRLYEPELEVRLRAIVTDSDTGYPLPQVVFVSDPGQRTFHGVVKLGPLSQRKDDLGGLSKLERLIARKFTKPWTFRYDRARWLFRKQLPGLPATEVRGGGRFQHQQLNP